MEKDEYHAMFGFRIESNICFISIANSFHQRNPGRNGDHRALCYCFGYFLSSLTLVIRSCRGFNETSVAVSPAAE
jgi:hypothetical protein